MSFIVGLDHVNITIDDTDGALEKAHEFYAGLLALAPLERPTNADQGRPGAWLACGAQQLHLTLERGASSANRATRRHPAFRVSGLEGLRKRLMAAGVEIVAGNRFPGQERFFVYDPWGNRLEFVERKSK